MLSLIPTYKDEPSAHGRCNSTGIPGGWMLHMASSYKAKILHTSARFPMLQHTAFYFPPFAKANGFETTDCLECLQILNNLIYGRRVCFKAGDWTLCTILGYGLPERETCCILPVNQLSRAYFLTKWKKCNIVSLFLQIHIVESTIHHSLMRMDSRQRIVSNACKSLIS